MHILTIANQKGGTGKTATTRALGDELVHKGYKVLMVDMDPPGGTLLKKIIKPVSDNLDRCAG